MKGVHSAMHSEIRIVSGQLEHRKFWNTEPIAKCTSLMLRERRYRGIKIKYFGSPSLKLRAIILGNLYTLQERDALRLEKFGTTVAIAGWIRDFDPTLATAQPRGWAEGKTWNDSDGGYMAVKKTAVVAENTTKGISQRCAFVLWHELGHALDHALGNYSHSTAFNSAYQDDCRDLDAQQQKELAYFLQEDNAGKEEVFAEIYGALNTPQPGKAHQILDLFPQSMLQILFRLQQPD